MQTRSAGPTHPLAFLMRLCLALACAGAALPIATPRLAQAATVPATASLTAPASVPLGQPFTFSLDFANVGLTAGYGPYLNLFLPAAGADGDDGITFISAAVLGTAIPATTLTCPAGGTVTSPLTNLPVSCPATPAGTNQLIILPLPFGSVAPAQATTPVTIVAQLSNLADLSVPLPIAAQAGFVYGSTPNAFEPSQGPSATANIQPSLFNLQKTANEPEAETATGPNLPRSYTLTPSMPAGLTATNVIITDTLPPDLMLISVSGATLITGPIIPGGPYTPPANQLVFDYGALVGTGAPIVIQYAVTRTNALGQPVLDPLTGAPATRTNAATASANASPIDPRDPSATLSSTVTLGSINRALALQKQVALPAGAAYPGQIVTYTLNFQVSDFFSLGNLILTDTLSDGQDVIAGSANLIVTDRNGTVTGAVPPAAFVTTSLGAAGTQVQFDVSAALVALGGADGILQGGHTLSPVSPVAASGSISYRARIADQYAGNAPLQPADTLSNTARMAGDVLPNANLAGPATGRVTDTSTTAFVLSGPALGKDIVALNGSPILPSPLKLSPNDVVTFRLVYDLPTGDFNTFALTDLLPAPLFDATTLTAFISTTAGIPADGTAQWGPGMSAGDLSRAPIPSLITSAADNSASFNFPNQTDPTNTPTHLEILLSARVSSQPFADDVLLVNRVNSLQTNTAGQPVVRSAAQVFPAAAPQVRLSKGLVAIDNPNAGFIGSTGPVPFAPISAATCSSRFTGTINTPDLQTAPINADLINADAADTVRMAILVENIGTARDGAYDVAVVDSLPAGLAYLPGTLCVQRGDGTALPYTGLDSALFSTGITLNVPLSQGLSYAAAPTTTGHNLAVLTFDVVLSDTVIPGQALANQARLRHFAAQPGAPNFVPAQSPSVPVDDIATVNIAPFEPDKRLLGTEIDDATTGPAQAVAGELVTYTLLITMPAGRASNVSVIDALPAGLAFVGCDSISASPSLAASTGFVTSSVCSTNALGTLATFNFGTLTNTNTNNAVAETLQITYTAVALNIASNITGTPLINTAQLNWLGNTSGPLSASASPITIIEPRLLVSKISNVNSGDASDTITFTLIITNPASNSTTLYDAVLTDVVPAGMVLDAASVTAVSGPTPLITVTPPTFTATWPALLPGQTAVISFEVAINPNVAANQPLTNTAFASARSLPGPLTPRGPNPNATARIISAANASAIFIVTPPQTSKLLIGTEISTPANTAAQVAIGERITYSVLITLPEGLTPEVRLTDTLDSGLAFVDFVAIAASADLQFAQPVLSYLTPTVSAIGPDPARQAVWSLGGITNTNANNAVAETVQFTYTAVALNTPINAQPQTRRNSAVLSWANGVLAAAQAPAVQIIEPNLGLAKSVATARNPIGAGDVLTYTLNLTNTGAAAAFDLNLTDTLPLSISYLATQQITIGNSPNTLVTDTNPTGATALAWQLSSLAAGGTATLVFTAQAEDALRPNLTLRNTATATSSSLPGPSPFKRAYTSPVALADVSTAGATLTFGKTTAQLSLAPGDLLTYTLRVTNTGIVAASSLVVTDLVPANTAWVSAAPASLAITANGLVTWTVPTVAGNSTTVLTLTVRANEPLLNGTLIVNTAHLTTSTAAASSAVLTSSSTVTSSIVSSHTLTLAKTVQPMSTAPGGIVTYTLAYTASGNAPATNLLLTDTLPISLSLLTSNPPPTGQQDTTLTWSLGTLSPTTSAPATGSITLTARVGTTPAPNGTQWPNTAALRDDAFGPVLAQASLTLATAHAFALSKTAAPAIATAGEPLTYTLVYTLTGDEPSQAALVTDALPTGASFISCSGGLSCSLMGGVPTWSLGDLVPPASGVLTVEVNLSAAAPGTLTNTARIGDANAGAPASATLVTSVQRKADLVFTKHASLAPPVSASSVVAGGLLTYTLRVTNTGPSDAAVVVSDTLPADTTFVSATPPATSLAGQQLLWQLGTLPANATVEITLVAGVASRPNVPPLLNTATVTSDAADPNLLNNTASVATQVIYADVFVQKTVVPTIPVRPGDTLTWTITFGNLGDAAAVDVTITDTLPAAAQFGGIVSQTAGLAGPSGAPPVLSWSMPTLLPGQTGQIVLTMTSQTQSDRSNVLINRADIGTRTPQTQTANDTASTSNPPLQLALTKTAGRESVNAGQPISFTLRLTNTGAVDLAQLSLTDTFDPAVLAYVAAEPAPANTAPGQLGWPNLGPLAPELGTQVVVTFTALQTTNGLGTTNLATATGTYTGVNPLVVKAQAQLLILPPTTHALQLSKHASPSSVLAGDVLTYTLVYTVTSDEPAPGAVLTDALPANVALLGCDGCDASAGNGLLRWALGNVNPQTNGARTVTVRVAPNLPNGSVLTNTAGLTDASAGSAFVAVTTPVNFGADIAISKAADIGAGNMVVRSGGLVTYTLTVTNYGPGDIGGPLPMAVPGNLSATLGPAAVYPMVIAVADAGGAIVSDLTVTVRSISHGYAADLDLLLVGPNGQAVTLMSDAGSIRPIADVTLRFHDGALLPPDAGRIVSGVYAPSDYVGNDGAEVLPTPAPTRPYATELAAFKGIPANGEWRLFVFDDQVNDTGSIAGGWMLTLATDQGPRTYTSQQGLRVEDSLPPGSTVVDGTPRFGGPNPLVWLDGILAGQSRIYTVTTRLNYAGQSPVQNTARVSQPVADLNPGNNTSTVSLTVAFAGVSVITATRLPTLTPGSTTLITIPLVNGGNVTGTGFVITVTLPEWLDFTNPPPGWLEVRPGVWVIPIAGLPPGSEGALVLPIEVPAIFPPGVGSAEIVIVIGGPDGNPSPIVIPVPVDTRPRLVFDKSASPPSGSSLHIGDRIAYTLVVTHAGPLTLTQLTLRDAVPASTAYVPGSAQPAAQASASGLEWSIGVLPPQTTLTFTFAVTLYRTSATTYPISNTATLQSAGLSATASNVVLHVYLPDQVQLSQFTILPVEGGRGLRIQWTTLFEVDVFGFALYRSSTGQRADAVLVTAELVPAQGVGASYEVVDGAATTAQPNVYWLQEIETTGRVNEYGPFAMPPGIGPAQNGPASAAQLYLPVVLR